MITRDFMQALLRTSSAIKVSIPMTARCFARKSISSRICFSSSASLFRPDHILLHVRTDAWMEALDRHQVHLSSHEIFEIKR